MTGSIKMVRLEDFALGTPLEVQNEPAGLVRCGYTYIEPFKKLRYAFGAVWKHLGLLGVIHDYRRRQVDAFYVASGSDDMDTKDPNHRAISRRIAQICLAISIFAIIFQTFVIEKLYVSSSCYHSSGRNSVICDQSVFFFLLGLWAIIPLFLVNTFWSYSLRSFNAGMSISYRIYKILTTLDAPVIPGWLAMMPICIGLALFAMLALYGSIFGLR